MGYGLNCEIGQDGADRQVDGLGPSSRQADSSCATPPEPAFQRIGHRAASTRPGPGRTGRGGAGSSDSHSSSAHWRRSERSNARRWRRLVQQVVDVGGRIGRPGVGQGRNRQSVSRSPLASSIPDRRAERAQTRRSCGRRSRPPTGCRADGSEPGRRALEDLEILVGGVGDHRARSGQDPAEAHDVDRAVDRPGPLRASRPGVPSQLIWSGPSGPVGPLPVELGIQRVPVGFDQPIDQNLRSGRRRRLARSPTQPP